MNLYEFFLERFPMLLEGLSRAALNGKLAHAYLVYGDDREMRLNFAKLLSQMAACSEAGKTGKPCSVCESCRKLAAGSYPELHLLRPSGKAYQIRVGEAGVREENTMRTFEEDFYLTSGYNLKKIGWIVDADRLNPASQNAFLKTLEEPPEDTMLILLTAHPEALLATTRSRCQMLEILTNECHFDFSGAQECFEIFYNLLSGAKPDAVIAGDGANRLLELVAGVKEACAVRIREENQAQLDKLSEFDPQLGKKLAAEIEDSAVGEYRNEREVLLGAIHTYFAQLYLVSSGIKLEDLANPEVFTASGGVPQVSLKRAEILLKSVEELLFALRFNVNEELVWRSFILQLLYRETL